MSVARPLRRAKHIACACCLLLGAVLGLLAAGFVHALAWTEPVRGAGRATGMALAEVLPAGSSGWGFDGPFRGSPRDRASIPPGDLGCFVYAANPNVAASQDRVTASLIAAGGEWPTLMAAHTCIFALAIGMMGGVPVVSPLVRRKLGISARWSVRPVVLRLFAVSAFAACAWPFIAQAMFVVWQGFVDAHSARESTQGFAASLGPFGAGGVAAGAALCDAMSIVTIAAIVSRRRGVAVDIDGGPVVAGAEVGARHGAGQEQLGRWPSVWFVNGWLIAMVLYATPLLLAWIGRVLPSDLAVQRYVPF